MKNDFWIWGIWNAGYLCVTFEKLIQIRFEGENESCIKLIGKTDQT